MVRNYTATIGRIDIVSSTSEDAKYLQENLRPEDVRECIIHGVSPNRALHMPLVDKGCKTLQHLSTTFLYVCLVQCSIQTTVALLLYGYLAVKI